jgi:hypothetical protein
VGSKVVAAVDRIAVVVDCIAGFAAGEKGIVVAAAGDGCRVRNLEGK